MKREAYFKRVINNKNLRKKVVRDIPTTYACRIQIETLFHLEIAYLNRSESYDMLIYPHESEVIAVSSCMLDTQKNYL